MPGLWVSQTEGVSVGELMPPLGFREVTWAQSWCPPRLPQLGRLLAVLRKVCSARLRDSSAEPTLVVDAQVSQPQEQERRNANISGISFQRRDKVFLDLRTLTLTGLLIVSNLES